MHPLRLLFCLPLLGLASVASALPAWWAERSAVAPSAADDYAAANLGQLKQLATAAALQMNLRVSGGAGTTINPLVSAWTQPAATGVTRDDFATLNQGQLKTVAKPFYDRLSLAYPWTTATTDDDDYALINLGQLKYVFSFPIAATGDSDADGLADTWETTSFGNLTAQTGAGNADGDALSNRAESLAGTNAGVAATTVPAATLGLVIYSP